MPRAHGELVLLALLSAASAAGLHLWLFADGSLNNDEVAYLLQADALAHGHLFLPVTATPEAVQPWFFVARSPGFVSKYLPLVSAMQAVGLRLTGSVVPVLALLAALVPVLVHALARETGLGDRAALLAAGLVAASPVVVMEAALPLSYVPFLVLVSLCWLLVLRLAHGRAGPGAAVALGLAGTAAAATRPYDAVLLLAPPLLWAAARRRADLPRLLPALVLGALPLAVAVGVYDTVVTGRPWALPFGLLEPADAVGFGTRKIVPEDGGRAFGPAQGLQGLVSHLLLGPLTWGALGLVVVPAAVLSWRRAVPAVRVLLVAVGVHLLGYFAFWGPWNFSVLWGRGTRVLGPVYAMALLVPLVLAALPVLDRWRRARPARLRAAVVVAGVLSLAQLANAVVQGARDESRTDRVLAAADRGRALGPLLLDVDPPYLGHPVSALTSDVQLSDATPVPAAAAPLPVLLQLPLGPYGTRRLTYALTRQRRVQAPQVALDVGLVGREEEVLIVERAGRTSACAATATVRVVLTAEGVSGCQGAPVPASWYRMDSRRCPDTSCVSFTVYGRTPAGALKRFAWRRPQVAPGPALLVDGEVVESAGAGWLRVAQAP